MVNVQPLLLLSLLKINLYQESIMFDSLRVHFHTEFRKRDIECEKGKLENLSNTPNVLKV